MQSYLGDGKTISAPIPTLRRSQTNIFLGFRVRRAVALNAPPPADMWSLPRNEDSLGIRSGVLARVAQSGRYGNSK
jgi:hypothetical protein